MKYILIILALIFIGCSDTHVNLPTCNQVKTFSHYCFLPDARNPTLFVPCGFELYDTCTEHATLLGGEPTNGHCEAQYIWIEECE